MLCNVFFLLHNLHTSRQQELALAILDLFFINRQPLKLRWLQPLKHSVAKMGRTESCTTGRAGGLNYEPLKAVENLVPPKGGGLFK